MGQEDVEDEEDGALRESGADGDEESGAAGQEDDVEDGDEGGGENGENSSPQGIQDFGQQDRRTDDCSAGAGPDEYQFPIGRVVASTMGCLLIGEFLAPAPF